ncbi:MAG: 50S ribosomal protein L29 [Deltaproteobacteria bacterium]|nr:50S ribosomal protein L29 [Deltaproteobacteria bacterium]MBW1961747.1 50S ribosomal protein L29 [Deltaproteobacteria bacterium]MBW1994547.1 50S ribosomal protein L29 [Deltaproteobacteria bacterium]MBW2151101.1 50S ribosomal protein L29 [Deltaproteobacteria bacterium]
MKPSEIRELSIEEMRRKRDELKQELFNLRFQHGAGQLENTARLLLVRRDIARVETILRENYQAKAD